MVRLRSRREMPAAVSIESPPDGRRALDAEVERLERIVKTARTIRKAAKA